MGAVTISLSKEELAFVRAQVKAHGFRSAREYLEHLVVMEQLRFRRAAVDGLLHEGLESGRSSSLTKQDGEDIEGEGLARLAEEKGHARKRPKMPPRAP
jgi:hypothetical protein